MGVTNYSGVQGIYFRRVLKAYGKIGNFSEFPGKNLLDFGCGTKELKKFTSNMNYIGYDRDPKLSDTESWEQIQFHTLVINHTLMYMDKNEICSLFSELNNNLILEQIIIGVGRQNRLSDIGKRLLGEKNAHSGTLTEPREQLELITEYFNVISSKSVFFMTDILLLKPKKRH